MMNNFTFTFIGIIFLIGYFITGIILRVYDYSRTPEARQYSTEAIIKYAAAETFKWTMFNAKFVLTLGIIIDIILLCLK